MLSPGPDQRILDVGAGKGIIASLVQNAGKGEVHALDPNAKRVAFMEKKHPNVKTCLAAADKIPYFDGYFDKVIRPWPCITSRTSRGRSAR
jgi:ubiquinone/menaquinone biosynthesis C-methylase UbiE